MSVPRSVITSAIDADAPFPLTIPQLERGAHVIIGDEECCVAAITLQATPGIEWAYVKHTRTYVLFSKEATPGVPVRWRGRWVRFSNPLSLTRGIDKHDGQNGTFPPGEYTLQPVSESERRSSRDAKRRAEARGVDPRRQAQLGPDGLRLRAKRTRPAYAIR